MELGKRDINRQKNKTRSPPLHLYENQLQMDQWSHIKLQTKERSLEQEKVSASYTCDRRLIFRSYNKLKKIKK